MQVVSFTETILDEGGAESYWNGAKEKIRTNIEWRKANEESITDWLVSVQS